MSPDVQLLERYFAEEDREALDALIVRHYPAVYQTILHLVHNSFDAKDIAQASFMEVIRVGRDYRGTGSFRAWLLAIAVNQVRQHRRKHARRCREDWLYDAISQFEFSPDVTEDVTRREFEQHLERALERMAVSLKEPLVLHYYESLSFTEIAEVLDLPRSTVQSRVEAAIAQLRRDFRAHGALALIPCIERFVVSPAVLAPSTVGVGIVRLLMSGVLLMKSKLFLGFALLVLLVTLGSVFTPSMADDPSGATPADSVKSVMLSEKHALGHDLGEGGALDRRVVTSAVTAIVQGIVFDELGEPIAAAELRLFVYASGDVLAAKSGPDGSFAFESTQGHADLFHLTVTADGFARCRHGDVRIDTEPLIVGMERGLVLRGRLVDHADRPLARYRIRPVRQAPTEPPVGMSQSEQLLPFDLVAEPARWIEDPLGAFSFDGLASGAYALIVEREGHQPWRFSPDLFGNEGYPALPLREAVPITLQLGKAGRWQVRVFDAVTGKPVLGAKIEYLVQMGSREDRFRSLTIPARASAEGLYSLDFASSKGSEGRMKGGKFVVSKSGYGAYRLSLGGQDPGYVIDVPLARAACIEGVVFDSLGKPHANAVVVYADKVSDTIVARRVTTAEGRYRFDAIPAYGAGELRAFNCAQTEEFGVAVLLPKPGVVHRIDLGGGESLGVFGRVTRAGRACPGVLVVCRPDIGEEVRTYSGRLGGFRLDGLMPGPAEFVVSAAKESGLDTYFVQEITIPEESLELNFPFDRSIRGRLLETKERRPVDGLDLRAHLLGAEQSATASASVNTQGEFTFTLHQPGLYELRIDDEDEWFAMDRPVIDVRNQASYEGLEFLVLRDPRSGEVEISVVDSLSGQAITEGEFESSFKTWTGVGSFSNGELVDKGLSLGAYLYRLRSPSHVTKTVKLELLPGQTVYRGRVSLEPSVRLLVSSVRAGSNAAVAGLLAQDMLVQYDGKTIASLAELQLAKRAALGRPRVTVLVDRKGERIELSLRTGQLGIESRNLGIR